MKCLLDVVSSTNGADSDGDGVSDFDDAVQKLRVEMS